MKFEISLNHDFIKEIKKIVVLEVLRQNKNLAQEILFDLRLLLKLKYKKKSFSNEIKSALNMKFVQQQDLKCKTKINIIVFNF